MSVADDMEETMGFKYQSWSWFKGAGGSSRSKASADNDALSWSKKPRGLKRGRNPEVDVKILWNGLNSVLDDRRRDAIAQQQAVVWLVGAAIAHGRGADSRSERRRK